MIESIYNYFGKLTNGHMFSCLAEVDTTLFHNHTKISISFHIHVLISLDFHYVS